MQKETAESFFEPARYRAGHNTENHFVRSGLGPPSVGATAFDRRGPTDALQLAAALNVTPDQLLDLWQVNRAALRRHEEQERLQEQLAALSLSSPPRYQEPAPPRPTERGPAFRAPHSAEGLFSSFDGCMDTIFEQDPSSYAKEIACPQTFDPISSRPYLHPNLRSASSGHFINGDERMGGSPPEALMSRIGNDNNGPSHFARFSGNGSAPGATEMVGGSADGTDTDSWRQARTQRPWSAPGWNQDARNFEAFSGAVPAAIHRSTGQRNWIESRLGDGTVADVPPSDLDGFVDRRRDAHPAPLSAEHRRFGLDDDARLRARSASNPLRSSQLLITSTNEALALASLQHVTAGNSLASLYAGLRLDDPNALVPASNHGVPLQAANQAGLYRAPYGPSPFNKKVDLYKTELCRQWEEKGWCDYRERCQFAHGPGELRAIKRHPLYKTQVCKAFVKTGHCQYGKRCTFRHDVTPNSNGASTTEDKPLMSRIGRISDPATTKRTGDGRPLPRPDREVSWRTTMRNDPGVPQPRVEECFERTGPDGPGRSARASPSELVRSVPRRGDAPCSSPNGK